MKFYSSDYILPISADPIKNGIIQVDSEGTIINIGTKEDFPTLDLQYYPGVIIPGFINAHCHLELSHMKSLCETGTGLIEFIGRVVSLRSFNQEVKEDAIAKRDIEMYEAGIQAVGDICNNLDTAATKKSSPIHYYSFIELFDLMQKHLTATTIENYKEVFKGQDESGSNKKSFVPHAPYSVTPELLEFINQANPDTKCISIHNQETPDETMLFKKGNGGFYKFYSSLGLSLEDFKPTGKTSIDYIIDKLKPHYRNLFVHNTLTNENNILNAHKWSDHVYWVSCPNANLYIENKLPDYQLFLKNNAKLCLGTDSIMSNWQLSIWEEVKTIKKYQSYVPLKELLEWSTINGAKALSYEDSLGTLDVGKKPGLVNLNLVWYGEQTDISESFPTRIN